MRRRVKSGTPGRRAKGPNTRRQKARRDQRRQQRQRGGRPANTDDLRQRSDS